MFRTSFVILVVATLVVSLVVVAILVVVTLNVVAAVVVVTLNVVTAVVVVTLVVVPSAVAQNCPLPSALPSKLSFMLLSFDRVSARV